METANFLNVTTKIIEALKIKHTSKYLKDQVLPHQDHSSLLAISDTLNLYKIQNTAVKIANDKFNLTSGFNSPMLASK